MGKINVKNRFLVLALLAIMVLCISSLPALAAPSDGYYTWSIESSTYQGDLNGTWQYGPSGRGPGTLTLSQTATYSHSYSGSPASLAGIASFFGVSFGQSYSTSVSFSVQIPTGESWQIIYRPVYNRYKVVEQQYFHIDGSTTKAGSPRTTYVNIFSHWDYDHRSI